MATFLRRDDWVTDAMGNAISGASVYVCSQPATTTSIPPSPLQQLYSDPAGANPITQPVVTDGYGHAFYYATPGTYTVVYYSPQILQQNLPDQAIGSGNVTFPITIAEGGTNATTASQALINLGAAASGANSDITSLVAIGVSGGANTTTLFNAAGWQYGTASFATGGPTVQVANQAWTGTGFTGLALGVSTSAGFALMAPGLIGTSGTINAPIINAPTQMNAGYLRVGATGVGIINSFTSGMPLQVGALGNPTGPTLIINSGQVSPVNGQGLLKFDSNYFTQTTVGAAGGASALPATPRGYLQFVAPDGTTCVIPYYAHS